VHLYCFLNEPTNAQLIIILLFITLTLQVSTLLLQISLFNTQNVIEKRLVKLYYFEAAEFENNIEIALALVFELQLWPEISLFSTKY